MGCPPTNSSQLMGCWSARVSKASSWCFTCWVLLALQRAAPEPGIHCADKLDDCSRFAGKGPTGGGCERHPEYMRTMCAHTCGFCSSETWDTILLKTEQIYLAGINAHMLAASGIRCWRFFELPIVDEQASCLVEGQCNADASANAAVPLFRTHVAAAHFYDSRSHSLNSSVFRWDPQSASFLEHQRLPTVGAWDLAAFSIGETWYLVVASFFDGQSRNLNSTIYRWDVRADRFFKHQELPTVGAMDVEFFPAAGPSGASAFLVFTGNHDGSRGARAQCIIYRWDGELFSEFQVLETTGGYDAEAFETDGGEQILVVVHEQRTDVYRAQASALATDSSGFHLIQSLEVPHGRDAEHFLFEGGHFVAVAVFRTDVNYEAESQVYMWNSSSGQLEIAYSLRGGKGTFDIEVLRFESEERLLIANQYEGISRLYQYRDLSTGKPGGSPWKENGTLPTPRVYDVAWHHLREANRHFLGVARFGD